MKDFSNLLEKIIFTPSRNSKISIISQFFKNSKNPERGFALAILTGNLKIADMNFLYFLSIDDKDYNDKQH